MGRSALGGRVYAAAALMASCFMVTASAQQASVPSAPTGSTPDTTKRSRAPEGPKATEQPQTSGGGEVGLGPRDAEAADLPVSLDRVRKGLAHEPVLRLTSQPVFRLDITERRPRSWDLQPPFLFSAEPRTSTTRWHDEFLSMVTPTEATMYGSMLSTSETATIAATSLLFAGAASLLKAGFSDWKQSRREGKAREARDEVDAAMAAWALANEKR